MQKNEEVLKKIEGMQKNVNVWKLFHSMGSGFGFTDNQRKDSLDKVEEDIQWLRKNASEMPDEK